jgi:signal transduction histidine kinase
MNALLFVALLINLLILGFSAWVAVSAFNTIGETTSLLATTMQMQAEVRGAEAALYRYLMEGEQGFVSQYTTHFEAFEQELTEYQAVTVSPTDEVSIIQLLQAYEEANEVGNTLLSLYDQQQIDLEILISQRAEITSLLDSELSDATADDPETQAILDHIHLASSDLGLAVTSYLIAPEASQRQQFTQAVTRFNQHLPQLRQALDSEDQQLADELQLSFEEFEQTGIRLISKRNQQQSLFAQFAGVFYLTGQEVLLGTIQPHAQQTLIDIQGQLRRTLFLSVGISLGTAIVVVGITIRLTLPLLHEIRQSISALAQGADRIGNGNFSEPVQVQGQDDDMIRLADVLNTMMRELEMRENRLRARISEFETLRQINLEVTSSLKLHKVLSSIVSSALRLVQAAEVHIFLLDEGGFSPTLMASAWDRDDHPSARMPRPDGLVATVARTRQAKVINQADQHEMYSSPEIEDWGILAAATFPLMVEGTILGVFYIAYSDRDLFSDAELRSIQLLVDQATVAIQNARLYKGLLESEANLQEMAQKMMTVQEAERHLVGLDLHDGLTQMLMSINMHLNTLAAQPLNLNPLAAKELGLVRARIRDAIEEVRQVVSELRPIELSEMGLVDGLQQYLLESRKRRGWQAEFKASPGKIELTPLAETAVFRIVQEALNNAYRHGKTNRIRVTLLVEEGFLLLSIKDWGRGFSPEDLTKDTEKFGLLGMRERALLLKGTCEVRSAPGEGTEVLVQIPV